MPEIVDDSIDADIRAAIDAGAGDAPAATAPATADQSAGADEAGESGDQRQERPRNERGQFASRTGEAQSQGAPQEGGQASLNQALEKAGNRAQDTTQPAQLAEPTQSAIRPPASLKAAVKAKWSTLDPEIQQEFARIDKTALDGRTEWASKGERLNRYDELLSPIRDQLALRGTDEFRFIQGLMMADGLLRGPNAEQALVDIAQMYGLRPPQQIPGPTGPDGRPLQADPHLQTLQRKVADLKGQLQQRGQTEEQAAQNGLLGQVEAFRAATNPDGSLKHLYFDNVRELMGDLLDSKRAKSLEDAYEMATHADPEVRKLVTAAQPRSENRQLEAKGLSVTGAPTHGAKAVQQGSTGSIEDDIVAAIKEHATVV
jgi:hypothetical protein